MLAGAVPVSTSIPATISAADGAGGSSPSTNNGAAGGAGKGSEGSAQAAIKLSATSAAAPPTGDQQEKPSGFGIPGGSRTNLTQAQLEALGFSPRREPPFHVSCVMPYGKYGTEQHVLSHP